MTDSDSATSTNDNRPTVYLEGDNWIYRASGSGACVRYLVASALGYEDQRGKKVDDLLDRSANEGYLHEDAIVTKLEEEGATVTRRQEEVMIQVIPKVFLRGHIEGLLEYENAYTNLFEAKSMSTKQFTKWTNHGFDSFVNYAYQISSYMKLFPELDVRYIVKRREDGFQTELKIPAGSPPIPFSLIRKKIVIAEKYRRKGQLPPCDIENQWGCPVWYLHDEDDPEDIEPLTEEMEEILGELVAEFMTLKLVEKQGKTAEEARKKISPEILNLLGKLDQTELAYKGLKYRVIKRRGGNSYLDKAKVKEIIGEDKMEEVTTKNSYHFPVIQVIK
ncbi:hypothetical protein LCGC14_0965760 [marine sediment metagenome]|uniref:YqaJ viral recombinase domain-containing protein n=1 Tax=marine sediment metagenome TaxID=412755 RepID=A0A0F9NZA5_9ZZZZ